jgi:predicted neutral ceramidase superfamily lipid hydrolase
LSRDVLSRRAQLIRRAILLCTFAAIIICSLIGLLFVDAMTRTDLSVLIALVFVLAMTALIGGLIYFLREIHLATAPLRARLLR